MNNKKSKTIFVSGNFNVIHPGHLRLLKFSKNLGIKLIVGVNSDRVSENALVKENLRLEGVKSISLVDEAFIIEKPIHDLILEIRPSIIVKGKEHYGKINKEIDALKTYGGQLIFSSGDVTFSSSDLIKSEIINKKNNHINLPVEFMKRHSISNDQLLECIQKFKKLNVLVLGDIIVDEYVNCEPLGMSQEDPTLVVQPIDSKKFIGGASIVAAHASSLGANVNFISVCGDDKISEFNIKKLKSYNVKSHILLDNNRPTTLKKRFRAKGKTLLRLSKIDQGSISDSIQKEIIKKVSKLSDKCDLILFSDFNYGCLPDKMINKIIEIGKSKNIMMVADSQSSSQTGDISRFKNMSLITPTEREARLSLRDKESGLVVLAEKLKNSSSSDNILLKLGSDGVMIHANAINTENWLTDKITAINNNPVDVAGAGDSMLVLSSLALALGANIWQASLLGSIAAAVQVSRIGNTPIKFDEILEILN